MRNLSEITHIVVHAWSRQGAFQEWCHTSDPDAAGFTTYIRGPVVHGDYDISEEKDFDTLGDAMDYAKELSAKNGELHIEMD